jgi:hypothetical protein
MKNTTSSKKVYIEEWISYIDRLYTLCMTKDEKLSGEVRQKIIELKQLVPKVADTKTFRYTKVDEELDNIGVSATKGYGE